MNFKAVAIILFVVLVIDSAIAQSANQSLKTGLSEGISKGQEFLTLRFTDPVALVQRLLGSADVFFENRIKKLQGIRSPFTPPIIAILKAIDSAVDNVVLVIINHISLMAFEMAIQRLIAELNNARNFLKMIP